MRTLNIVMSDREYKVIKTIKGRNTWHEWIMDMISDFEALNKVQSEMELKELQKKG